MKRYIFFFLFLLSKIYALPVGNPAEASLFNTRTGECCCKESHCFNFGLGFYGDYVFNRHMETDFPRHHHNIDRTRLFTNAAYLVLNVCDRFDVFSSLGSSRISLSTSLGAFNAVDPHPLFEVESGTAFSYGIGARATLFEYKCFSLGIEGEYFSTRPNIKRMYIASGAVVYPDDVLETHYSEWQVGSGVAYRYNEFFVPYAALKYAHSFWKFGDGENFPIEDNRDTFLFNMRNRKNWGYAVGLTLIPPACHKLAVTAEARFGGETAFYINAQARI